MVSSTTWDGIKDMVDALGILNSIRLKVIQSFGKFWKLGGEWFFTILICLDAPADVLYALQNVTPKTLLLSRKMEYKTLPVLPVNVDKFQIAPMVVLW